MREEVNIDLAIARLATRQGGVVARRQLLALGLSSAAIARRVEAGRLHVIARGVYAVGHTLLGAVGRRWAAVLVCGDGAVLSDNSAGAAWGLVKLRGALIDVSVAGAARHKGVRVHRRRLAPDEVTTLDGLPITTPQRTLIDLAAGGATRRQLEAAFHHAEKALHMDWGNLATLLDRHGGRPGVPFLSATLAAYRPADTHSELERIVNSLCADHGIEPPRVNVVIEGRERDFWWPEHNLVVEADSHTWHHSPSALNDDRERDVELTLAGIGFLRFTYEQATTRERYVRRAILRGLRVASAP